MKSLLLLLPVLLSSIAAGQTGSTDISTPDYRYRNKHGKLEWCVFCNEYDVQDEYETKCLDKWKDLPEQGEERKQINGKEVKFWPYCSGLKSKHGMWDRPRYIKNCTAAPLIEGAEVDCRGSDGINHYRVHDTCSVTCTGSRMVANKNQTTCDPVTAKWTEVKCLPNSCLPLSTKIEHNENASCNIYAELPLNTTCEVSCPPGYDPSKRVLQCIQGDWTLIERCAAVSVEKSPPPSVDTPLKWMIPLIVGGVLIVLIIGVIVIRCLRNPGSSSSTDFESGRKEPLLTPSVKGGSGGGSDCGVEGAEEESSFSEGSTVGSEVTEVKFSPTFSMNDPPPAYMSCRSYPGEKNDPMDGISETVCKSVEMYYKFEEGQSRHIPDSGLLTIPENTDLTLYAECTNGHRIVQFNYGPFFRDERQHLDNGINMVIQYDDEGEYMLCAKCHHQGEIILAVHIKVKDNPDQTDCKVLTRSTDGLGSLASTRSQPTLSAGSEPSQKLEAQMVSLPSNPQLMDSVEDGEDAETWGAEGGACGGRQGPACRGGKHLNHSTYSLSQTQLEDEHDKEVQSCTLHLTDLQQKMHKKKLDRLCLQLEPLSQREPDLTIFGATQYILGYSRDRVEHVIWAKREDLRNTPARTLLVMMMQAGKRAIHLVRYFSKRSHPNQDIISILNRAHPDCPVCKNYS